jgi:hypothetical protein
MRTVSILASVGLVSYSDQWNDEALNQRVESSIPPSLTKVLFSFSSKTGRQPSYERAACGIGRACADRGAYCF